MTWLLLALALLAAPRAAAGPVAPRAPASPRLLDGVAVMAVVAGSLAAGGVRAGVLLAAVVAPAVVLLRRLRTRGGVPGPSRSLPIVLVLVAASLRAGAPTVTALDLALPAADERTGERLAAVVGLLRLGASPRQAWAGEADDPQWGSVAAVAQRSGESGIRLAEAFERLAAELQQQLRAAVSARARRAGVLAVGPLGLCFLPAFVCLGVIPVIIGVAGVAGGVGRQVAG